MSAMGLAFAAAAAATLVACFFAFQFHKPPEHRGSDSLVSTKTQWQLFRQALGQPVLIWLFSLSVLMYGFSHIPFVFGQPFISEALIAGGWQAEVPLVSGSVSAVMMIVSVVASVLATKLR